MNCPVCKNKTKVLGHREREQLFRILRVRQCLKCDNKFSTIERIVSDRSSIRSKVKRVADRLTSMNITLEEIIEQIKKET